MSPELITMCLGIITLVLTTIGSGYLFAKDIKDDRKEDAKKYEMIRRESDRRWYSLLKEMNAIDKHLERLKK